jgi:hypothetical protein
MVVMAASSVCFSNIIVQILLSQEMGKIGLIQATITLSFS